VKKAEEGGGRGKEEEAGGEGREIRERNPKMPSGRCRRCVTREPLARWKREQGGVDAL